VVFIMLVVFIMFSPVVFMCILQLGFFW